jgi:DHA1 family bicyclomycin/chloramphenicol resistance-like MFS transporter
VPIDLRAATRVLAVALRHRLFLTYVVMFGLVGAATQMVFDVGPFLYQVKLGFSPEAYGLVALAVGVANLIGELACGALAQRTTAHRLAVRVFSRNIGLVGGLINTCCYLIVSLAMALMAYLPENSQAPLGWLYVGVGVVFAGLLVSTVALQRGKRVSPSSASAWPWPGPRRPAAAPVVLLSAPPR